MYEVQMKRKNVEQVREDTRMYSLFKKTAGRDGEIDWLELKTILDEYSENVAGKKTFSKDVCRGMIAMLDDDRSGKLNYNEFKRLWDSVADWKRVFIEFDKNESGGLSGFELRAAFNSVGYKLNNHILNIFMQRYGNKKYEIEFDDFIMCAIKLKIMIELFNSMSSNQGVTAVFTFEEWIEATLYA